MALEHWDSTKNRWVFYRNQEQHSVDCDKFPFEKIPQRIFIDTNVINIIVKFSHCIFEQASIPDELDRTKKIDIEALMHIFSIGIRANWNIVATDNNIKEIMSTPDNDTRENLMDYAINLIDSNHDDYAHAMDLGRRLRDAPFTALLPDVSDRELIGNAIGLGCDVFCTCDRKTIIKNRASLKKLPIRILTPAEWWAHVKPWGPLWL